MVSSDTGGAMAAEVDMALAKAAAIAAADGRGGRGSAGAVDGAAGLAAARREADTARRALSATNRRMVVGRRDWTRQGQAAAAMLRAMKKRSRRRCACRGRCGGWSRHGATRPGTLLSLFLQFCLPGKKEKRPRMNLRILLDRKEKESQMCLF